MLGGVAFHPNIPASYRQLSNIGVSPEQQEQGDANHATSQGILDVYITHHRSVYCHDGLGLYQELSITTKRNLGDHERLLQL